MKIINIQYFAVVKDLVGVSEEIVKTSAELASDLFAEICNRYHLKWKELWRRATDKLYSSL